MIKIKCIENYCNDMSDKELYGEIIIMLRSYNLKRAVIHPIFPKEYVIQQFKPYIKKYFVQCYGNHPTLQLRYKNENKRRLQHFFDKNTSFGRIIIKRNSNAKRTILEAQNKYKYTNYLSQRIPNYNFFEDIEKYNLRDDSDDEISDSDEENYTIDNDMPNIDVVNNAINTFMNYVDSTPARNTHIRYPSQDEDTYEHDAEDYEDEDEDEDEDEELDILLSDPVFLRSVDNQIMEAYQNNENERNDGIYEL